ncbi:hypothetical protein P12x_003059 [Tundrisphaera lichenicola]|uniref:hypothetical protein n=1 Tax=Tundrisphaera lichenicola TaxID=2029860 RepID=UPI003EB6C4B9
MTNRLYSETLATLAGLPPANQAAGARSVADIPFGNQRKILFTVQVGTPGAGGTVDFKVQASPTAGGTYVDIPGAAIVQKIAAGNAQVEVRADRLNALGLGNFLKAVLTVAVATTPTAVLVQRGDSRFQPASDDNDAGMATPIVI